jgi:hypothetical protein
VPFCLDVVIDDNNIQLSCYGQLTFGLHKIKIKIKIVCPLDDIFNIYKIIFLENN